MVYILNLKLNWRRKKKLLKILFWIVLNISNLNIGAFSTIWLQTKMKLFQLVQAHFATLGINANQSASPFNHKVLFGFSLLGSTIISIFIYAFREAKTIFEYIECVYAILFFTCLLVCFSTMVFQLSKSVEFYNFVEHNIHGKKKSVYENKIIHIHWNLIDGLNLF